MNAVAQARMENNSRAKAEVLNYSLFSLARLMQAACGLPTVLPIAGGDPESQMKADIRSMDVNIEKAKSEALRIRGNLPIAA